MTVVRPTSQIGWTTRTPDTMATSCSTAIMQHTVATAITLTMAGIPVMVTT